MGISFHLESLSYKAEGFVFPDDLLHWDFVREQEEKAAGIKPKKSASMFSSYAYLYKFIIFYDKIP